VPLRPLAYVRPDIYVKGGDYDIDAIPEARLVSTWGGSALTIAFVHDRSTTSLIERLKS
jgi:D-glycero-beta-D-manno-heptose 1-phosphate adenylyltransferase